MDRYSHVWESFHQLVISNIENGIIHNPINQENREYEAVRTGNVEELEEILKEDYTDRTPILSPDPVRHAIDIGIVITTRSRMAAAAGGVSPEICFCLSDATIRAMEASKDPDEIFYICRTSERRYAMLVREIKQGVRADAGSLHPIMIRQEKDQAGSIPGQEEDGNDSAAPALPHPSQEEDRVPDPGINRHLSHCKEYIYHNMNRKITVAEIADTIGLDANYLSCLFHKYEHIPLKKFILKEKISLAKNMLAYSPYSYIEIANYLGFSSQSHLGDHFRRQTGMTLRQYRERYSKEDFLQEVVEKEEAGV